MDRTGKIELYNGTAKASGKSFQALKLTIGKWSALHFPTTFEMDYLREYLKTENGTFTIDKNSKSELFLIAGDYTGKYHVDSTFEYKYLEKYFQASEAAPPPASDKVDDKIDLHSDEAPLPQDFFGK